MTAMTIRSSYPVERLTRRVAQARADGAAPTPILPCDRLALRVRQASAGASEKTDGNAPEGNKLGKVGLTLQQIKDLLARYQKPTEKQEKPAEKPKEPEKTEKKEEKPPEAKSNTYSVGKGDTLWRIAKEKLGSGDRWREIYELNKNVLTDPNRIFPGMVLKLPGASESKPEPKTEGGSGPLIRQGAMGEGVRKLQERLKELGFDPGPIDGDAGPQTISALKAFQKARGLEADGIAGPKTWDKLGITVTASVNTPSVESNSNEGIDVGGPQLAVRRQGKLIGINIADQFDRMVAAAAKEGVSLRINSGYRTHAEQQALWDANPNPTYVARPGTSNHEKGNAIDFVNNSGAYSWLKRNASRFGFQNYDPEPWHYSLNGR